MRQFVLTLAIVFSLLVLVGIGAAFPYLELRRFTEPPSSDPDLTARIISTIEANAAFPPGEFTMDVSEEVCAWVSPEELEALARQPGWQLTAQFRGTYLFTTNSFWPWDRNGLEIGFNGESGCYANMRRSDTI